MQSPEICFILCICQDQRETLDSLVAMVFLEILEILDLLVGQSPVSVYTKMFLNVFKSWKILLSVTLK